jgi:hypothetical protein
MRKAIAVKALGTRVIAETGPFAVETPATFG